MNVVVFFYQTILIKPAPCGAQIIQYKQILPNGKIIDLSMIHGLELLLLVEFGQHLKRIGRGGQNVQGPLGLEAVLRFGST